MKNSHCRTQKLRRISFALYFHSKSHPILVEMKIPFVLLETRNSDYVHWAFH